MPAIDPTGKIEPIIADTLADMGYRLVRVELLPGRRKRLQVMIERVDGAQMTVDDCAEVSPAISAILDVHDPISGAYNLEVSSPGIDRPLTRRSDFAAWAGFEAKLELDQPIDGRKRFQGRLDRLEAGDDAVAIAVADKGGKTETVWAVPYERIGRAKLVITDALMAATAPPESAGEGSVPSAADPAQGEA